MALKYFLLAFVAIFAIQGAVESKSVPNGELYGLGDIIKEIIAKIKEIIQSAINNAIKQLQDIIEQIIEKGKEAIAQAIEKLSEKVAKVIEEIKRLKEEAEKLNVNIEACLGNYETELHDLPIKIVNDLKSCVDDKIAEAQVIINETVNTIQGLLKEAEDLQNRFVECKTDIVCIAKVIKDARDIVVELPSKIEKHIQSAVAFIQSVGGEMSSCINEKVGSAMTDVNKLLSEITECIRDKLENETVKGIAY